jgi:hypothetical protein
VLRIQLDLLSSNLMRAAYVCEFWLVLLATHVVWPQAGGQGHLDIMAWYWKLFLPMALAGAITAMTVVAVVRSGDRDHGRDGVGHVLLPPP